MTTTRPRPRAKNPQVRRDLTTLGGFAAEIDDYRTLLHTITAHVDVGVSRNMRRRRARDEIEDEGEEEQEQAEGEDDYRPESEEQANSDESADDAPPLPTANLLRARYAHRGPKHLRLRTAATYWPLAPPSRAPVPSWSFEDEVAALASHVLSSTYDPASSSSDDDGLGEPLPAPYLATLTENARQSLARTLALVSANWPVMKDTKQHTARAMDWERLLDVVVVGEVFPPEVVERVRERMELWEGGKGAELAMTRLSIVRDTHSNLRALHTPHQSSVLADWEYTKPKLKRGVKPKPKTRRSTRGKLKPQEKIAEEDLESEYLGSGSEGGAGAGPSGPSALASAAVGDVEGGEGAGEDAGRGDGAGAGDGDGEGRDVGDG